MRGFVDHFKELNFPGETEGTIKHFFRITVNVARF
jgi:hypothetical protein